MKRYIKIYLLPFFVSLVAALIGSSFANGKEMYPKRIKEIAKLYGCYLDEKHYDENEVGTKGPYSWGVVKGAALHSSVAFWCNQRVEGKEKRKLVIHVDKSAVEQFRKEAIFSGCPNQITDIKGRSTGVWIENDAIYTGYEDGIYYYCKDGKWQESEWH